MSARLRTIRTWIVAAWKHKFPVSAFVYVMLYANFFLAMYNALLR